LIAIGGACPSYNGCQDGAYCDTATAKCVAKSAVGGKCTWDSACVDGTYCVIATGMTATGTCTNKKAAGETCTTSSECLGYCDSTTKACVQNTGGLNVTAAICANPAGSN
jgi:hypothetical protein